MYERRLDEEVHDVVTVRTRREALWLTAVGIAGTAVAVADHATEAKNRKGHKGHNGHKGHKGHHRRKRRKGGGGNGGGDGSGNQPGGPAQRPFPQHLTYAAGTIRPNHRTQEQQDNDLRAAYGRWKNHYIVNEGGGLYRVAFGRSGNDHDTTVSEGQGYGMIIMPLMAGHDPDAQTIFDGLWRFARNHPSEINNQLMDWRVPGGNGNDSAFDGDCDMAYGLLLAHTQWGSGGAIDYSAAGQQLLGAILASTIGPNSRLPLLGDWVNPNQSPHNEWSPRTSDFMLGHFRAFRRFTGDPVWDQVVDACQHYIGVLQQPGTGLLPDFAQSSGSGNPRPADEGFLEENDGQYFYNAGRDPWRIGTDALLNGDATSLSQARKSVQWIAATTGGNPNAIKSGYHLDGTPLPDSNYFSTFFAAPFGVAAMTDSNLQSFLNAVYDAVIASDQNYYEDSVALLCSLVLTGNFWDPTI